MCSTFPKLLYLDKILVKLHVWVILFTWYTLCMKRKAIFYSIKMLSTITLWYKALDFGSQSIPNYEYGCWQIYACKIYNLQQLISVYFWKSYLFFMGFHSPQIANQIKKICICLFLILVLCWIFLKVLLCIFSILEACISRCCS